MNTTMWLWKVKYIDDRDKSTEFYVAATSIQNAISKATDEISLRGDAESATITGIDMIQEVIV